MHRKYFLPNHHLQLLDCLNVWPWSDSLSHSFAVSCVFCFGCFGIIYYKCKVVPFPGSAILFLAQVERLVVSRASNNFYFVLNLLMASYRQMQSTCGLLNKSEHTESNCMSIDLMVSCIGTASVQNKLCFIEFYWKIHRRLGKFLDLRTKWSRSVMKNIHNLYFSAVSIKTFAKRNCVSFNQCYDSVGWKKVCCYWSCMRLHG